MTHTMKVNKTVIILSISSDIGLELAIRYIKDGYRVVGTYRKSGSIAKFKSNPGIELIACDIHEKKDILNLVQTFRQKGIIWDIFISCVGNLLPVGPFFSTDFQKWSTSVSLNSIAQLEVLHALHPYRTSKMSHVVFFAGGGVNKSVRDISAYTAGKILLIKMCEYLDTENKDMNFFIVGPGWVKTKIHQPILDNKIYSKEKYKETKEFMDNKNGTKHDDIYEYIQWLIAGGKIISGGRNFSVVHDPWRTNARKLLSKKLKADINMYKLRRYEP
jgi:short-subunit dehydrogenase